MESSTIDELLKAMFDESPLALDKYFAELSEEDRTFAAGFINGFMVCMMAESDEDE